MFESNATVATTKASRYLKALCGHFNRKVEAQWTDKKGQVDFGIGSCQMTASDENLVLAISAVTEKELEQLKYVVGDHLERFSAKDSLKADWSSEEVKTM